MDAEKIILNKNFYELSPSEKEALKDYAKNETEFNEIKSFLLAAKQSFDQQKLQVSDNLSQSILNHLHQPVEQKKTWYNTLMLFLFPEQKRFYQYPAFQIVFASLLILFIINIIPNILNEGQLAVNNEVSTTKQEQKVNDEDFPENKVSNELKTSKNTLKDSNKTTYFVSSGEQIETSGNNNLQTPEIETSKSINTTIFDSNNSIKEEVLDEVTATLTNTPSIQTKEVNEDIAEDIIESDEVIAESGSNGNSKKLKVNNKATNAYNIAKDNQPSTAEKSKKNNSIQSISIQSTPSILELFYISK
jgi:hypothetical protein